LNWRRFAPAIALVLEGIGIGLMLPRFQAAINRSLMRATLRAQPPQDPPPVDPICPACRARTWELEHYGHTHIHAPKPSPLAAPE